MSEANPEGLYVSVSSKVGHNPPVTFGDSLRPRSRLQIAPRFGYKKPTGLFMTRRALCTRGPFLWCVLSKSPLTQERLFIVNTARLSEKFDISFFIVSSQIQNLLVIIENFFRYPTICFRCIVHNILNKYSISSFFGNIMRTLSHIKN